MDVIRATAFPGTSAPSSGTETIILASLRVGHDVDAPRGGADRPLLAQEANGRIGSEEGIVPRTKTITFRARIRQTGHDTGIPVPKDVVASLGGGKRPLGAISVNQSTYRACAEAPRAGRR